MAWRVTCFLLLILTFEASAQEFQTPPPFTGRPHDPGRTMLVSTWDRSGGNLDGEDFRDVRGNRNILFDVEGPGEVLRISTALLGEAVRGTTIDIYLDGAEEPAMSRLVRDYFSGPLCIPKRPPFAGRAGPYPTSFRPIVFRKSCRIELKSEDTPRRWGKYWQIAWTRLSEEPSLAPYVLDDDAVQMLGHLSPPKIPKDPDEPPHFLRRLRPRSLHPLRTRFSRTVSRLMTLEPGQTDRLKLDEPGVIQRLGVTMWPIRTDLARSIRFQVFWDGADEPSIDAPLAYLFGINDSWSVPNFRTALLGRFSNTATLELTMPFGRGSRIVLENRSDQVIPIRLSGELKTGGGPVGFMDARLHATWREQRAGSPDMPTVGPKNIPVHVALDREARGKYVGLIQHVEWPFRSWWGEGDVMIWVDDDPEYPPAWHGTGNEEYFYSAWCKFAQTPFSGAISERPGDVLLHTVHSLDPIAFQDRIKVAIETVGQGPADDLIRSYRPIWGTTAFWYSDKPHPAGSTPELLPRRAHPPLVNDFTGAFEEVQARGVTRFTRDGSEPTEKSPVWEATTRFPGEYLRARTFHPHRAPSAISYVHVPEDSTPLAGQPITNLIPGESWAVFFGDFTDVPRTQGLKAVATGNEADRARIAEHVMKRSGKPVAFRTQGFFVVEKDGRYVFDLNGAKHARLTVNGRVLVAPDIDRSSSWPPCAPLDLAAGAHAFTIESLIHAEVDRLALYRASEESERNVVPMLRRK